MACLKSSAAIESRFKIPDPADRIFAVGVAKLASPSQRCSGFYRVIALIDEFLLLSPYGSLMFAAPATANGLSRLREWRMRPESRDQGCHSL